MIGSRDARRRIAAVALSSLLGMTGAATGRADDAIQKLDQAKAALAAKQATKAYLAISNALSDLAARTPLFLTAAALVDQPSRGYGQYARRPHNAYTRDQPIQVYIEPAGFDHAKQGELFRMSLACDYQVLDQKGKVLTADRTIKEVEIVSRQANAELGIDITMPLFDLPPGKYTLEIQVRDQIAGDSARIKLEFRMI